MIGTGIEIGTEYPEYVPRPELPPGYHYTLHTVERTGPDGPGGTREYERVYRVAKTPERAAQDRDEWYATAPSLDSHDDLPAGGGRDGYKVAVAGDRATITQPYPLPTLHAVNRGGRWHLIGSGNADDDARISPGALKAIAEYVRGAEDRKAAGWRDSLRSGNLSALEWAPPDLFERFPSLAADFPEVAARFRRDGGKPFAKS